MRINPTTMNNRAFKAAIRAIEKLSRKYSKKRSIFNDYQNASRAFTHPPRFCPTPNLDFTRQMIPHNYVDDLYRD